MQGFDKRKGHQMLTLMLNLRFKGLHLITTYVGRENEMNLVVNMICNYHYLSYWMLNVINEPQVQGSHVDHEILFQTTKTNPDIFGHLVLRKLHEYFHYHVNANCKDALS